MKRLILTGVSAFFVGALPLSAQAGSGMVEHLRVGTLESLGVHTNRITLAPRRGAAPNSYLVFDTNDQTQVRGLGQITEVSGILRDHIGTVVVVTYTNPGNRFLARRILFTNERRLYEMRGSITSIDTEARTLSVRNAMGHETRMELGFGPGTGIDSDQGLLRLSDLRVGQEVLIDYAPRDPIGAAPIGVAYMVRTL